MGGINDDRQINTKSPEFYKGQETEDGSDEVRTLQDAAASLENENDQMDNVYKQSSAVKVGLKEPQDDVSGGSSVPTSDIGRESISEESNPKHSGLSGLEKCLNLDTDFISKAQYKSRCDYCQKYLEKMNADDSLEQFRVEFPHLFELFQTVFVGSQRLVNKVKELKANKNIIDAENRKIKIKLEDKDKECEGLGEKVYHLRRDLLDMENENTSLRISLNNLRSKKAESYSICKQDEPSTDLREENKLLQEKCSYLKKKLVNSKIADSLNDEIQRLVKSNEMMTKEFMKQKEVIFDIRGDIDYLETQMHDLSKIETSPRQEIPEKQEKCKLFSEEEGIWKLLSVCRYEFEQLSEKQTLFNKHIEQLQNYKQALEKECTNLSSTITDITGQLKDFREYHKQDGVSREIRLQHKIDQEQYLLKNKTQENSFSTLNFRVRSLNGHINGQNPKFMEKDWQINSSPESVYESQESATMMDKLVNERTNNMQLFKLQIPHRSFGLMDELEFMDVTRQEREDNKKKYIEKLETEVSEEEVKRPYSLNRWRILEGIGTGKPQPAAKNKDPQQQGAKMMTEQNDSRKKDALIQEQHKQIKKWWKCDAQKQLCSYKKELEARTERLNHFTAENSMFQNLCRKHEHDVASLRNQLSR